MLPVAGSTGSVSAAVMLVTVATNRITVVAVKPLTGPLRVSVCQYFMRQNGDHFWQQNDGRTATRFTSVLTDERISVIR